jgi:hypothetical protein
MLFAPGQQNLENNPMHSSRLADEVAFFGFYEICLTRRAKQGYGGIIAECVMRGSLASRLAAARPNASFSVQREAPASQPGGI